MADWFRRIKAALTPQVLLLLLLAFSMIGYCALREEAGGADRLEKQASAVLSRMEGAGRGCGCSLNRRFVRCWACPIRR